MKSVYLAVLVGICSHSLIAMQRGKDIEDRVGKLHASAVEQDREERGKREDWHSPCAQESQTKTPPNSPVPLEKQDFYLSMALQRQDFFRGMAKAIITKSQNVKKNKNMSDLRFQGRGLSRRRVRSSSSSGEAENELRNLKARGDLDDHKTEGVLNVLGKQVQMARAMKTMKYRYVRPWRAKKKKLAQKERERKREMAKAENKMSCEQQMILPNQVPSTFPIMPSQPLVISTVTPLAASPTHQPIPGLFNPASPTLLLDQETPEKPKSKDKPTSKLGPAPQSLETEEVETPPAQGVHHSPTACC